MRSVVKAHRLHISGRKGFTLVEVVVALVLVVALVAFIYPVVLQQIDRYHALHVARDLNSLRSSLRTFNGNIFTHPRYLDQLVNQISETSDSTIQQRFFVAREVAAWNGPYFSEFIPKTARPGAGTALLTGFDGRIINRLQCVTATNSLAACEPDAYLAVRVEGLNGLQFDQVNELIDGSGESTAPDGSGSSEARTQGRLRFVIQVGTDFALSEGVMFYFARPFTK